MIDPELPLEKQLRIDNIRRQLPEMSRDELEEYLVACMTQMVRLTHLSQQLLAYINGEL